MVEIKLCMACSNSGGFGREVNYTPVRYTFDGTLKEMFMTYQKPRTVRKLYYQKVVNRVY